MRCPNCSMGIVEPNETCGMCGIVEEELRPIEDIPKDNYEEYLINQKKKRSKVMAVSTIIAVAIVIMIIIASVIFIKIKGKGEDEEKEVDLIITTAYMEIYQNPVTYYRSADLHIGVKNQGDLTAIKDNITFSYGPMSGEKTERQWIGDDIEPEGSEIVTYGFGPVPPANPYYRVSVFYLGEHQYSQTLG